MSEKFELSAVVRTDNGKGASRRLRHQGLVPAIIYGGSEQPLSIVVNQNELVRLGKIKEFYSSEVTLKIEGKGEQLVKLQAVQRHLYKPLFQHVDFKRIK